MKFDPNIKIECTKGVYDPAEDSFLLVEIVKIKKGDRVLDMGTGTGIVALHCASAGAIVEACDSNSEAIACARANTMRNSLKIKLIESDLFTNVRGKFGVICFNPPYLPSGDDGADDSSWSGGSRGIELLERFLDGAKAHLAVHGRVYTIVSSLAMPSGRFDFILNKGYSVVSVTEKKLFFETLFGLELSAQP